MTGRQAEHIGVLVLGFLAGAALSMCIAPGDVCLWVVTGVVLALFSRAFFASSFGEEAIWPFAESWPFRRKKKH